MALNAGNDHEMRNQQNVENNEGMDEDEEEVKRPKKYEPNPQRPATHWTSIEALIEAGINEEGIALVYKKAKITCRQCYGFGHSIQNCATNRHIENYKKYNILSKSFFSRYLRKSVERNDMEFDDD
jgi:hypothetical protein